MDEKGHVIKTVAPDSIAWELGIESGDRLISINDQEITDVFDYRFLIQDEYIEMLIQKYDGEEWIYEVEKDMMQDIGMDFGDGLMDEYRSCQNKCIFCFIDQMPEGMRDTLYFKDDDSRLSFLQGNYITLTNMKDSDIERMIRYHLEPVNISVHSTDPDLRNKLLNNRFAGSSLRHLRTLFEAGIHMNMQIVLCKDINDGKELEKTISDLADLIPMAQSLSVVPAGLTKFREDLPVIEPFKAEDARKVLEIIDKWRNRLYKKYNSHFVHASDEWYILAGYDFPAEMDYDGYPQLENGVGMMRLLTDEFQTALAKAIPDQVKRTLSIATGTSAGPYIKNLMKSLHEKFSLTEIDVHIIQNDYFGESITVSGLITGRDLMNQLKNKELGERLLLPINMFRSGEDVFLDDIFIQELENELNTVITVVDTSGEDLLEAVLNNRSYTGQEENTGVYRRLYDAGKKGESYE